MKKRIFLTMTSILMLLPFVETKAQLPTQQQQQQQQQIGIRPSSGNQQSSGRREIRCGGNLAIYVACGRSSGVVQLIIDGTEQRDKITLVNSGDGAVCSSAAAPNDGLFVNPSTLCPGPVQSINIEGHGGNDRIDASLAPLSANVVIHGGAGNDKIRGHDGHDEIYSEGGNDDIFAYGGDDSIFGGAGNDRIDLGLGNDYCYGGSGNDAIFATNGSVENYVPHIYGDSGDDYIVATAGTPWVFGGSGNDSIMACGDIRGESGNDRLVACSCNAAGSGRAGELTRERLSIDGGEGSDRIKDSPCGHYVLSGGGGDDYYYITNNASEIPDNDPGTDAITGLDVDVANVYDGRSEIVQNMNPRCSDGGRGTCSSSWCTVDEPFCYNNDFFNLVELNRPEW